MSKADDFAELAVILSMNTKPHKATLHKSGNTLRNVLDDARRLTRNANMLKAVALAECNGFPKVEYRDGKRFEFSSLTEEDQKHLDKRRAKSQQAIVDVLRDYQLAPKSAPYQYAFSNDPRGCAVKVAFKNNHWCA